MSRFYSFMVLILLAATAPQLAHAIQTAIVGVDKAIVYSDVERTSPIGYVRGGRQLRVGSKTRRGGAILSIVVAGRIAYISAEDVAISNDPSALAQAPQGPKLREHEIDLKMGEVEDDLTENNYLVINLGQFSLGGDLEDLNQGLGVENSSAMSLIATFEHRPVIYNFSWNVGFGLYTMSNEVYDFQTLTIEGNVYYSLLETDLFDLQAYVGLTLSGDIRITSDELEREEKGAMWGHQFGGALKIAPRQKWGLVLKAGIQQFNPTNLGDFETSFTNSGEIQSVQGLHLSAGIAYKF